MKSKGVWVIAMCEWRYRQAVVERTTRARTTDGEREKEQDREGPSWENNRQFGRQLMFILANPERIRSLSQRTLIAKRMGV